MEKNDLIDVTPPTKHKNKGREPGSKNLPMSIIIAEMKAGKTPKQIAETYGLHINTVNLKRRQAVAKIAEATGRDITAIKRNRNSGRNAVLPAD